MCALLFQSIAVLQLKLLISNFAAFEFSFAASLDWYADVFKLFKNVFRINSFIGLIGSRNSIRPADMLSGRKRNAKARATQLALRLQFP